MKQMTLFDMKGKKKTEKAGSKPNTPKKDSPKKPAYVRQPPIVTKYAAAFISVLCTSSRKMMTLICLLKNSGLST